MNDCDVLNSTMASVPAFSTCLRKVNSFPAASPFDDLTPLTSPLFASAHQGEYGGPPYTAPFPSLNLYYVS